MIVFILFNQRREPNKIKLVLLVKLLRFGESVANAVLIAISIENSTSGVLLTNFEVYGNVLSD